MPIDNFNPEEYIEQINLYNDITKNESELETIRNNIIGCNSVINLSAEEIEKLKKELKDETNIWNLLFSRKRINAIKAEIKQRNNSIDKEKEKLLEQEHKKSEFEDKIRSQQSRLKLEELSELVTVEDNVLKISDKYKIKNITKSSNEEVLVHCTDFFPKNKTILTQYDGSLSDSIPIIYNGEKKDCKVISHRHTVHFVQNGVVESTGDGSGVWNQPKYIIITPKNNYINQIVSNNPSDMFTYGSVKLIGKPIMLVRSDAYNEIDEKDKNDYKIIKYEGSYVECLNRALNLLGICKDKSIDRNSPGHAHSIYYSLECTLNMRDGILNYIKNNNYDCRNRIIINREELTKFIDITQHGQTKGKNREFANLSNVSLYKFPGYFDMIEKSDIPKEIVHCIIEYGIKKEQNGYTFDTDEELYQKLKLIESKEELSEEEREKIYLNGMTLEKIKDIYNDYLTQKNIGFKESNTTEINYSKKDLLNQKKQTLLETRNFEQQKNIDSSDIGLGNN